MSVPAPHFLLFSEARRRSQPGRGGQGWRFVLEAVEGDEKVEAADEEPGTSGDRLDLLAVVRGLEALDQPSRVTLVTSSRYVSEGLRNGLNEWRASEWQWERYGEMVPIKNLDLWRRVDRALKIHQVECRRWKFDGARNSEETTANQEAELEVGNVSITAEPIQAENVSEGAQTKIVENFPPVRNRIAARMASLWDRMHGLWGGIAARRTSELAVPSAK